MKLLNKETGEELIAEFELAQVGQSAGLPELVIRGRGAVLPVYFAERYEILEAREEELSKMRIGGYPIKNEGRIKKVR